MEQRPVDLLDADGTLQEAFADADVVIHLAGTNEQRAALDPERALTETIRIARRVAVAAATVGASRLVVVSTVHVYDRSMRPGAVLTEALAPNPGNLYAVARLAGEHVSAVTTAGSDTDLVIFRVTNAVGAPADASVDRWSLVANDLCRQAVTHGRLELRTHGAEWRDFVPLAEVCRIVGASIRLGGSPSVPPGIYNLGHGRCMTVRDLAALVQSSYAAITGRWPPLTSPDPPARPPGPYTVSVQRLAALGLGTTVPIRAAVDETIEFCRAHQGAL